MRPEDRCFLWRAAIGLALFELLAAMGWLFGAGLSAASLLTAFAGPPTFWMLLASIVVLAGRFVPEGLRRRVMRPLVLLAILGYLCIYAWKLGVFQRFATEGLPYLGGGAVLGAALFAPVRIPERPLVIVPLVSLPALILGLALQFSTSPQVTVASLAGVEAPEGLPDLVVISWDTVRADVLEAYGAVGTRTPHLDRLVEEGVLFEDAVATAPITGPSHATMLTGLYPPSHGLRSNIIHSMGTGVGTMPELLSARGYRNGGFISAYPVLGRFGFARGFHHYDDRLQEGPAGKIQRLRPRSFLWVGILKSQLPGRPGAYTAGSIVNERALTWLDEEATGPEPLFLFLHYYDAHGPFEPPAELAAGTNLARKEELVPPVYDRKHLDDWALYRAEIEQLDGFLGEVLTALEARDPGLENTLIVLTSDHGECFGEADVHLNHTPSLHEATQHVPLVVRFPGKRGAGTRVAETVSHLDIAPTLLAAAGIGLDQFAPAPDDAYPLQLAYLDGMGYEERPVYMEAQQHTLQRTLERKIGWRTGMWKYLERENGDKLLYAYREDEDTDVGAEQPDIQADMKAAMEAFLEILPKVESVNNAVSAADERALAELGYAGNELEVPSPGDGN